jgi:hypothetical protein
MKNVTDALLPFHYGESRIRSAFYAAPKGMLERCEKVLDGSSRKIVHYRLMADAREPVEKTAMTKKQRMAIYRSRYPSNPHPELNDN